MEQRGLRKTRIGIVVSDKMDKTVTIAIERKVPHPIYKKYFKKTTKLMAHDEKSECRVGDKVKVFKNEKVPSQPTRFLIPEKNDTRLDLKELTLN